MLQNKNGKRSISLAGRLFMASCIFLMGSIIYAHYAEPKPQDLVYAASEPQIASVESAQPAVPATPAVTPPVGENTAQYNQELNGLISQWVQSQPSTNQWGVAVKGLGNSGIEAGYAGDTTYEAASIFKLYLVYALSQKIPEEQWSTTKVEGERTLSECVKAMLERSDNACGIAVGDKLGWGRSQQVTKAAGYTHTNLNGLPITTTPNDTLKFLEDLYDGTTFTPQLKDEILGDMRNSIFKQGIVAGCAGCVVANKTGANNGYQHDVAVVGVDGKVFALSIFSKGGTFKQTAALTTLIQQYIRSH